MPEGLQIILLPANLSLEGLPASMAIPASFTIPQQLQSYGYILTAASDPLPTLPAGFNASSPSSGALLWRQQSLTRNLLLSVMLQYCRCLNVMLTCIHIGRGHPLSLLPGPLYPPQALKGRYFKSVV